MKSTYKLIGVFWDGKPEARGCTTVLPYDPYWLPLSSQPCLLDLIECRRHIRLSQLLAIRSQQEVALLAEKLDGCTSLAIIVDYLPKAQSCVHRTFFKHRVLQVLGTLSAVLPEAKIFYMEPSPATEVAAC